MAAPLGKDLTIPASWIPRDGTFPSFNSLVILSQLYTSGAFNDSDWILHNRANGTDGTEGSGATLDYAKHLAENISVPLVEATPLHYLRLYVSMPFRPTLPRSFTIQMEIAIAIICTLLVLAAAVVTQRLREGSFWLFRRAERGDGVLIIPNAVTCESPRQT